MGKMNKAITVSIVAILFVSAIAGTIIYYNGKISNLNNQISKLNGVIASFPTPHLVATLGITEILGNESSSMGGLNSTPVLYNYLYITGSVNNTGKGTAYNAGLLVAAYDVNGTLEVNMTIPFGGIFGSDNVTNDFVLKNYGSYNPILRVYTSNYDSTLGVLDGEHTTYIDGALSILHESTVSNWTITPVWTKIP
jgi:hypothetical protein